ncbi:MAG: DUF4185 domain-containing protein [Deltaproteobacteria bacterium]|nr:DUF4185 domain-containing protein [Deltaproteobacteria bacterium]
MKRLRRAIVVACLIGVYFALFLGCELRKRHETTPDDFAVADDPLWEAVFQRTEGWTGADGINTADLLDGRILWIFGDTWIGEIQQGRHALPIDLLAELVNNTLAVHEKPDAGYWMPPDPKAIRFYWGQSGQKNLAWIRPEPGDGSGWYWPAGNGLMVKAGFDSFRLLFFMSKLSRSPASDEMWAFYRSGNALVIVNNPDEDVLNWRIQKISVPLSPSRGEKIGWGVTLLSVPVPGEFKESYLYIYGIDESDLGNKKLLLARSPSSRVEETGAWQAYHGDGVWGTFASECYPIAEHLASELSIEPVVIGKSLWYVMVHSEDGFGSHILIRMAQHPEGPWSQPFPIYQVEDVLKNKAFVTYAAKSHACISRPGELLISYVINAIDFDMVSQNADLYRPRFIRISLNRLLQQHNGILLHNNN